MSNGDLISVKRINGVVLDLDDTLYNYTSIHLAAISEIKKQAIQKWHISSNRFELLYKLADARVKKILGKTAACHHKLLYFKIMSNEVESSTFMDAYYFYQKYWDYIFQKMILNPGVLEFLTFCKKENIKVGICTDQLAHIQYKKIESLGITEYIDVMVTSEEIGAEKPSPNIFIEVLNEMKLDAGNVVMIGDDINKDCIGAYNVGIKCFIYDPNNVYVDKTVIGCRAFVSFNEITDSIRKCLYNIDLL